MGQEIIDIFYLSSDRSQKAANPVRSELSFDGSSTSVRIEIIFLGTTWYQVSNITAASLYLI